jgi:hypothetical protein
MRGPTALVVAITLANFGSLAAQSPPAAILGAGADPDLTPPALRLPGDVRPTHYDVDLFIDPETGSFHGEVGIDLRVGYLVDVGAHPFGRLSNR